MTKYTAADFANARFAKHEDGRRAVRLSTEQEQPWRAEALTDTEISFGVFYATDGVLARTGWVPVPSRPTITESEYREGTGNFSAFNRVGFDAALRIAGVEVVPDPEPTNTDRLEQLIRESDFKVSDFLGHSAYDLFAKYLNGHGVTAPNAKGN